jgi:peptidoglycan-associated lipoprotein
LERGYNFQETMHMKENPPMRRTWYSLVATAIFASSLLITLTGCHKKVVPPPPVAAAKTETPAPPAPPAPAPKISLSVSPDAIEAGQSTTLSWTSSNATTVIIDNGVGTVESSGSRRIGPKASTTYEARATGPGGTAVAQARVTVTTPPPVVSATPVTPTISDALFFEQNIKDAYFDYDQYNIRPDAQDALQADARALNQRSSIRITIEGHCDERGSEKYNLALGDRRANAAKDFLVGQGISAGRIDTISYGKEKNECEAHTEECWQRNRRAHPVMR